MAAPPARRRRLKRSNCAGPGIRRRGRGRGFVYVAADGTRITDEETLERIRALAIPPAWTDVWICPDENGHIQALGTDAAGRRQYRYHQRWRERKDQEKFDEMLRFARALPHIREVAGADLQGAGLHRDRVLACAVRLLDRGFFRIGGEEYAEDNGSYGLATLHKRHVALAGGNTIVFDYVAKSGKRRTQTIVDADVYAVVAELKARRGGGRELLAYTNGVRRWIDVRAADINDYIKDVSGGDFTAKAFRTWHATVLAAVALAVSAPAVTSKTARKRAMTRAAAEVAHYLGNTPAIARNSYIDPRVFDRFESGFTIGGVLELLGDVDAFGTPATQGAVEQAVLDLLEEEDSDAVEKVA